MKTLVMLLVCLRVGHDPRRSEPEVVTDAFMMDTFEPITDFEKVYFDEQKGLQQWTRINYIVL